MTPLIPTTPYARHNIAEALINHWITHGTPATLRECCAMFGWHSLSTATRHMESLIASGHVRAVPRGTIKTYVPTGARIVRVGE